MLLGAGGFPAVETTAEQVRHFEAVDDPRYTHKISAKSYRAADEIEGEVLSTPGKHAAHPQSQFNRKYCVLRSASSDTPSQP